MSIVALKRKSSRFQDKISGKSGFSINGTLRNQGWVGQTSHGRSITRTPFRGHVPIGHGGSDGKYVVNVVDGGPCIVNDASIVKRSNMNNKGKIYAHDYYPTPVFNLDCNSSCKIISFKDFSPTNSSASVQTKNVKNRNMHVVLKSDAGVNNCKFSCDASSYHIGGKYYQRNFFTKNSLPYSSSEYINVGIPNKNALSCQNNCYKSAKILTTTNISQNIPSQTSLINYASKQLDSIDGQFISKTL